MKWDHNTKLYHSDVRWLSRGKILSQVISLRSEIHNLLVEKNYSFAEKFGDSAWVAMITFLSDMFEYLNTEFKVKIKQ